MPKKIPPQNMISLILSYFLTHSFNYFYQKKEIFQKKLFFFDLALIRQVIQNRPPQKKLSLKLSLFIFGR